MARPAPEEQMAGGNLLKYPIESAKFSATKATINRA